MMKPKLLTLVIVGLLVFCMVCTGSQPANADAQIHRVDGADFLYKQGNLSVEHLGSAVLNCPLKPDILALFRVPPTFLWYRNLTVDPIIYAYYILMLEKNSAIFDEPRRTEHVGSPDKGDLGVHIRRMSLYRDSGIYWCVVMGKDRSGTFLITESLRFHVVVRSDTVTSPPPMVPSQETIGFSAVGHWSTRLHSVAARNTFPPLNVFTDKPDTETALTESQETLTSLSPAANLMTIFVIAASVGALWWPFF